MVIELKAPCNIGETVYSPIVDEEEGNIIEPLIVCGLMWNGERWFIMNEGYPFEIGVEVFIDLADAEAVLGGQNGF